MGYTQETLMQKNEDYKDIELVWEHFFSLSQVPRPSRHEEQARAWVLSHARKWSRKCREDDFGNIVIEVPATSKHLSEVPCCVFQSHLDMVCEKDTGVKHDFLRDPLRLKIERYEHEGRSEEWVCAEGTSLGADNGIAVAMAMALADSRSSVPHGPLQLLFTLDEETGLTGAAHLDSQMIDASYLINVDTSEENVLCIGCAGGCDFIIHLPVVWQSLKASFPDEENEKTRKKNAVKTVRAMVTVDNLSGGHSGVEIFSGRGNAIKILEKALSIIQKNISAYALRRVSGGNKRNAIPRTACAEIYIKEEDESKVRGILEQLMYTQRRALPQEEKRLTIELVTTPEKQKDICVLTTLSARRLLDVLRLCPTGVLNRTGLTPDETTLSTNLASVKTFDASIQIVNNSRFSFAMDEEYMRDIFDSVCRSCSANGPTTENTYQPWEVEKKARLRKLFAREHKKQYGTDPRVQVVHAGLECGLVKARLGEDAEAISIGAEIRFQHSPQERINIESMHRVWKLITSVLPKIVR